MKLKQKFCKDCEHCWVGKGCVLLHSTKVETEQPCGKWITKYPLKKEIEKMGVKIHEITYLDFDNGVWDEKCNNIIDPCTLNKGNCKYFNKKKPWFKFW